ncbi:MAG: aminoglycoside phosphotransferase family protein [Rhodospirillales bacterium]|nr:aminoglycoside phosphotransferase family protein [Rhodospirillales bacterium]
MTTEFSPGSVRSTAERLCGESVISADPVSGSGNNRVYRVEGASGLYALKLYPPQDDDPRDRLGTEFTALQFLTAQGPTSVPEPLARDTENNAALYQWIDGDPITEPDDGDIGAAVEFVAALKKLSRRKEAQALPPASEACLSARDIIVQISGRLQRLEGIAGPDTALQAFLADDFSPVFADSTEQAGDDYERQGLGLETPLDRRLRILSPSDFGFHNALRQQNEACIFLDFEYFGWDDPVKLACDFLLHPGMALNRDQSRRFAVEILETFKSDNSFPFRFNVLYSLFALRWCLILLNEYLPERWARRKIAGKYDDQKQAQEMQLQKARDLLRVTVKSRGRNPYGN